MYPLNPTIISKLTSLLSTSAKRYERLLKAHNIILTNGGGGGVKKEPKKEPKDSKAGVKGTPSKKRKLAAVDENAGDADEPIKTEIKGEVKTEDSIAVKAEQENSGNATVAVVPNAALANATTTPGQPSTSPSANAQNDDDDDEVLVISATEKRDDGNTSVYGSSGHHHSHSHSHSHSPAPIIPGIHSFDYAANMGFPQQMATPPMTPMQPPTRMASMANTHNSLPYGFPPNPWMYPHDTTHHGFI